MLKSLKEAVYEANGSAYAQHDQKHHWNGHRGCHVGEYLKYSGQ